MRNGLRIQPILTIELPLLTLITYEKNNYRHPATGTDQ